MKKRWLMMAPLLLLTACKQAAPAPAEAAPEPVTIAVTRWTGKTELFLEHPALIAGQDARFAVHLTDLSNFKALTAGRVTVELRRASGGAQSFQTEGPSRPGIFGVTVKPSAAGSYSMSVRLESAVLADLHEIAGVQVYADATAAAQVKTSEGGEAITFLKEQQWTLDFATEPVVERSLRESLRVTAEVQPRAGGEADVIAPIAGRLLASNVVPAPGTAVQKGQVLARIVPRTSGPADRAAMQLALEEASTALSLAQGDLGRAERLVAAGAVPGKRLDEARAAEGTAKARVNAAQSRLRQHESSRSAEGDTASDGQFLIRAPIAGVIASVRATPGLVVEEGQSLFRVVATDSAYVVAHVPEADGRKLRQFTGGEMEIGGTVEALPLGRLVSMGRVVDAQTRTLPVIFETNIAEMRVAIGQSIFVRLFTPAALKTVSVPLSALLDDAGQPIVFVQVSGESFARRAVRLGNREGGFVQVAGQIKSGERVVSRGAYQIRLAALSPQVPSHGHVH